MLPIAADSTTHAVSVSSMIEDELRDPLAAFGHALVAREAVHLDDRIARRRLHEVHAVEVQTEEPSGATHQVFELRVVADRRAELLLLGRSREDALDRVDVVPDP